MESSSTLLTNLNQRKSLSPNTKSPKNKRKTTTTTSTSKPIKVRYISNPMRVETCASKFRELVQELTGQDAADLPHQDPATFAVAEMNPAPLDDEEISEYYSTLDHDQEVFNNATQMSAGLSGFFSSGFYNVNAL